MRNLTKANASRAGARGRDAGTPMSTYAHFRRRKLEIRADAGLSWEKKERAIKALSDEHYESLGNGVNGDEGGAA